MFGAGYFNVYSWSHAYISGIKIFGVSKFKLTKYVFVCTIKCNNRNDNLVEISIIQNETLSDNDPIPSHVS